MPISAPASSKPCKAEIPTWNCTDLDLESAQALVPAWSDLALNAIEKNVFYFPWFIIPSLPLLEKQQPKVVTVHHANQLIGLFLVHNDVGYANMPIPFYRTTIHLHQFLGTPLVRTGYADQFAAGVCAFLDAAPKERSFLLLTHQTGDSDLTRALECLCKHQSRQFVEVDRVQRAAIGPLTGDGTPPDKHLSSNRKKSLSRKLKNLIAQGDVCVEKLTHEGEIDVWLEGFFAIENAGWKGEQKTSILSSANDTALYRDMVSAAFTNGSLNFFRMKLDGKPIAYTLDISGPPYTYCLKTSFDPAFKKYSPGILMEFETLKYYAQHRQYGLVDSCSDPANTVLNELWPNQKSIVTIAIGRRGLVYKIIFWGSYVLKEKLKSLIRGASKP